MPPRAAGRHDRVQTKPLTSEDVAELLSPARFSLLRTARKRKSTSPFQGRAIARAGQSHMTSVPQTPDGKHIAVAKLVGAGFKPSLVPQARCNAIASMRQAVAQAGGVFKQNRRPNSEVPEFGCGRWRIDPTSASYDG